MMRRRRGLGTSQVQPFPFAEAERLADILADWMEHGIPADCPWIFNPTYVRVGRLTVRMGHRLDGVTRSVQMEVELDA